MKKAAVNEASLKQGVAPSMLQKLSLFIHFLSQLKTAFFPSFFVIFSFALWPLAALFIAAVFQDR